MVTSEAECSDLDGTVTDDTIINIPVHNALIYFEMGIARNGPTVGTESSQTSVQIIDDLSEGYIVLDPTWSVGEAQLRNSVGPSTSIRRGSVEAVRADTESGRQTEIEVVEFNILESHVVGLGPNESVHIAEVSTNDSISIIKASVSNDQGVLQHSITISDVFYFGVLNTSDTIVSDLEILENNVTRSFSDSTIETTLPGNGSIKDSWNLWILPIRIIIACLHVVRIVGRGLAWELVGYESMENSETVLSNSVNSVVSEFSEFGSLWANVRVKVSAHAGFLHIKPVTVGIGTSYSIIDENVIGIGDPPSTRSLISVEETV